MSSWCDAPPYAAATTFRHSFVASARKVRRVDRETRDAFHGAPVLLHGQPQPLDLRPPPTAISVTSPASVFIRSPPTAISVTSPASVFIRSHWWCPTSHRWYPDVFACAVPWSR